MTRRLLAGPVVAFGLACASLALTGWWLQTSVLDSARVAEAVSAGLERPAVRTAFASALAGPVAGALGAEAPALQPAVEASLADPGVRDWFGTLAARAHARAVGADTGPVVLAPSEVTRLAGRPATQPAVPLEADVAPVGVLVAARRWLAGAVPALLALAVGATAAGALAHPRPWVVLRRVGWWGLVTGLTQLTLTMVAPRLVAGRLGDPAWAEAASAVVAHLAQPVVPVLVALAVGGGLLLAVGIAWPASALAGSPRRRRAPAAPDPVWSGGWSPPPSGRPAWPPVPQPRQRRAGDPDPYAGASGRSPQPGARHQRPADGRDPERPGHYLL